MEELVGTVVEGSTVAGPIVVEVVAIDVAGPVVDGTSALPGTVVAVTAAGGSASDA